MKLYIIAGEASGDLHGSNLMKAILNQAPKTEFRFWGGDLMQGVQDNMVTHYKDMAFMGFIEVVKHLNTIRSFFKKAKKDIIAFKADRVILIDYPGFNLRMAKWLHENGIPVTYYITPQIWAWHKSRVQQIKAYVDQVLCILPFEEAFFRAHGVESTFVGHPLTDAIELWKEDPTFLERHSINKPVLAILPGSRKQEVSKLLPSLIKGSSTFKDSHQIVVAKSKSLSDDLFYGLPSYVKVIDNSTYDILNVAKIALVASGTATLETALHGVPQVVCYKTSPLSYQIGKRLIDLKFISLVNLILDKPVVAELIQGACSPENIHKELLNINSGNGREKVLHEYKALRSLLGTKASKKAAEAIIHQTKVN